MSDLVLIRIAFLIVLGALAFFLRPFQLPVSLSVPACLAAGALFIVVENRIRKMPLRRLLGAVAGGIVGIVAALLVSLIIRHAVGDGSAASPFLHLAILTLLVYVGIVLGSAKSDVLSAASFGGSGGSDTKARQGFHVVDTSVIIDGRISDIAETGFLDGGLAVPQFVLRELQMVADSSDSLRRNRGRRGLDVLQRLQKMPGLEVRILEDDFPNVREVDMKLVELGKVYNCKVLTNDFNLNKVAQLHGVEVLNINELANALKPVVLPGETMRVFVLKEGKEYNQGVAYLDDGTMVVIDNARRMISKTIDIS
ncbi:MAG TPA: PIN domain-containing protein, partial [Bryobacteraceae bacterium]|nr:PIN domain-containing protein [Bryobacteraceae bacterium]